MPAWPAVCCVNRWPRWTSRALGVEPRSSTRRADARKTFGGDSTNGRWFLRDGSLANRWNHDNGTLLWSSRESEKGMIDAT